MKFSCKTWQCLLLIGSISLINFFENSTASAQDRGGFRGGAPGSMGGAPSSGGSDRGGDRSSRSSGGSSGGSSDRGGDRSSRSGGFGGPSFGGGFGGVAQASVVVDQVLVAPVSEAPVAVSLRSICSSAWIATATTFSIPTKWKGLHASSSNAWLKTIHASI